MSSLNGTARWQVFAYVCLLPGIVFGDSKQYKFCNNTGANATDLHIRFSIDVTFSNNPNDPGTPIQDPAGSFKEASGSGSGEINLAKGFTGTGVSSGSCVVLTFEFGLSDPLSIPEVSFARWTGGNTLTPAGNSNNPAPDGDYIGAPLIKKTKMNTFEFVSATGNGKIRVTIDGVTAEFQPTPGDSGPQSATKFANFIQVTFPFGAALCLDANRVTYAGLRYTDVADNITVQLIDIDSTQGVEIFDVASGSACIIAAPADPEPSPQPKNRYISFVPGNPGAPTAIRVALTTVSGFPASDGQVRWVGPPALLPSGDGGQFWAAPLQCTPHFMEWDDVSVVNAHGAEVVPSSTYDVQIVNADCDGALDQEACYSMALTVLTGKWGDVRAPYGAGQPTFVDISAIVDAFAGNASSIGKARAQLQPNAPNPGVSINFADISACVGAFQGNPYSYAGPSACP